MSNRDDKSGESTGLAREVDRDRLLRMFLELVAIDSPTGHEEAIGQELISRFEALGCSVSQDQIGNVVAVLPGTRPDTILISTHMDTAGTDVGIQPIIEDGVINTDGSTILGADDKSGHRRVPRAAEFLHDHPEADTRPRIRRLGRRRERAGWLRQLDVGKLKATHGFVFDTAARSARSPTGPRRPYTSRPRFTARRSMPAWSRRRGSTP